MAQQADQSPEQKLYAISGELERLVWRLTLQAASQPFSPDLFRVLQLATVVELPPNVYIQSIRIASYKPLDRYLHVWCVVPTPGGNEEDAWEERTLLRFHTPAFPDPQFTQHRAGMDLNLAWWETVRERLRALTSEMEHTTAATNKQTPWPGVGDDGAPFPCSATSGKPWPDARDGSCSMRHLPFRRPNSSFRTTCCFVNRPSSGVTPSTEACKKPTSPPIPRSERPRST